MNKLLNKGNRIIYLQVAMCILLFVSVMLFLPHGSLALLLNGIVILVAIVGMSGGVIAALGFTLVLFFFIGSALFWMSFTNVSLLETDVPYISILIWMVILLLLSFVSGRASEFIKTVLKDNDALREQIRTLVAVDPITGFDNKERMLVELELEYSRSKRYGHTFTLLLIKLNYFDPFQKLYGEAALISLLQTMAQTIFKNTRASDHKFRPEQDVFALLLTDTPEADVQVVIDKLNQELSVYQLKNKKYITLSFEYSAIGFSEEIKDHLEFYDIAMDQVTPHVS